MEPIRALHDPDMRAPLSARAKPDRDEGLQRRSRESLFSPEIS